ncbi:MAG: YdcH family protein [Pseudomonadota bacterium]
MQTAHLSALEAKHASLDAQIADHEGRPSPDHTVIADLKKRKLRLKEEMAEL